MNHTMRKASIFVGTSIAIHTRLCATGPAHCPPLPPQCMLECTRLYTLILKQGAKELFRGSMRDLCWLPYHYKLSY